jgi:ADP-heptose:LPS heptosyltransferase
MNLKNKINFDYLKVNFEIFYFLLFIIISFFQRKKIKNKTILIINPCLLGDFCSSVHFIHKFIIKNKGFNVDILVEENLISFARKIKGVNKVFSYKGFNNKLEYEEVLVLRANTKILKNFHKIKFNKIKTNSKAFFFFGKNITKSYYHRKNPKSFREISFDIIKYKPEIFSFEEIFEIKNKYDGKVNNLKIKNPIFVHIKAS